MKEFSDSLPASDLEHFRLNKFNYFRKYICVHASSIHLMKKTEEENETATISNFFTSVLFISVTKKFSFSVAKTISLKIEKKTTIEVQSEVHALVNRTSESHFTD